MAEIKKYLDTQALGTLVEEIKKADTSTLNSAKSYADSLAKNYDSAGSAASALTDAKAYTDTLANGQVKINKEAIETLNGSGEGSVAKAIADAKVLIDADIDAVEGIANQNKTDIAAINNVESGILAQAKGYTDTEVSEVQGNVNTLSNYVGTFTHDTAKTVVEYINAKTDGIATSGNLEALGARVTTVEGKVSTIEGDYLKGSDKTELEGKINLKANQTALDEVASVANAAVKQSDYDAYVESMANTCLGIEDLVVNEVDRALGVESGLNERLEKVESFFELAEGESLDTALDTLVEIQNYITTEGAAADQMVLDIAANKKSIEDHIATDHDFAGADAALKTELEGKINLKADSSVVTELSGKVNTNEQAILALQGVDTGLDGRISALEAKHGNGEGTVESLIATAKQEAIDTASGDATSKANTAESNAKSYTDTEVGKDRARLDALEAIPHHEHSNKGVLDGITSDKVSGWDNAVAKVHEHSNKGVLDGITSDKVSTWDTVTSKASQTDLDAAVLRIAANEGNITTLNNTIVDKAEQDDLDAAVLRIAANEGNIATLTSAVNSFTPITSDEVKALFA